MVQVHLDDVAWLRFDDGTPVSAASGIAPLGDGWLIAQDDATHGAWWRPAGTTALLLLPPADGRDRFTEADGSKHLKPDLEVAVPAEVDGAQAVLLLGSGSSSRRMRGVAVHLGQPAPRAHARDLTPLYRHVAACLGLPIEHLNLEGGSRHGDTVRWFNRGNLTAGVPSSSVEVSVADLVAAVLGRADPADLMVRDPRVVPLGSVDGVGLAVTDAVALPDGRVLVSAAAEDTPNAVDDGPVVATALALVDGEQVVDVVRVPRVDGRVAKVEGLALRRVGAGEVGLLAVVDDDDPSRPSAVLHLRVVLQGAPR